MYKVLLVFCTLLLCCYCLDNEVVSEESRAKKKRSNRLWIVIFLLAITKVVIFKAVSIFVFFAIFQKFFSLAGLVMSYVIKNNEKPSISYGSPEYNTIGYSYNPPEDVFVDKEPTLSNIKDFSGWLFNKG